MIVRLLAVRRSLRPANAPFGLLSPHGVPGDGLLFQRSDELRIRRVHSLLPMLDRARLQLILGGHC